MQYSFLRQSGLMSHSWKNTFLLSGFSLRAPVSPTNQNMHVRCISSQHPWPRHWLRIWSWSQGAALWLPTAPQGCVLNAENTFHCMLLYVTYKVPLPYLLFNVSCLHELCCLNSLCLHTLRLLYFSALFVFVCASDPNADPLSAEARISQEASELEKRLSMLSNCSLASSAGTSSCYYISIRGSSDILQHVCIFVGPLLGYVVCHDVLGLLYIMNFLLILASCMLCPNKDFITGLC